MLSPPPIGTVQCRQAARLSDDLARADRQRAAALLADGPTQAHRRAVECVTTGERENGTVGNRLGNEFAGDQQRVGPGDRQLVDADRRGAGDLDSVVASVADNRAIDTGRHRVEIPSRRRIPIDGATAGPTVGPWRRIVGNVRATVLVRRDLKTAGGEAALQIQRHLRVGSIGEHQCVVSKRLAHRGETQQVDRIARRKSSDRDGAEHGIRRAGHRPLRTCIQLQSAEIGDPGRGDDVWIPAAARAGSQLQHTATAVNSAVHQGTGIEDHSIGAAADGKTHCVALAAGYDASIDDCSGRGQQDTDAAAGNRATGSVEHGSSAALVDAKAPGINDCAVVVDDSLAAQVHTCVADGADNGAGFVGDRTRSGDRDGIAAAGDRAAAFVDDDAVDQVIDRATEIDTADIRTAQDLSEIVDGPAIGVTTLSVQGAIAAGCLADPGTTRYRHGIVALITQRNAGARGG